MLKEEAEQQMVQIQQQFRLDAELYCSINLREREIENLKWQIEMEMMKFEVERQKIQIEGERRVKEMLCA